MYCFQYVFRFLVTTVILLLTSIVKGQITDNVISDNLKRKFNSTFEKVQNLIKSNGEFSKAVYLNEKNIFGLKETYSDFETEIYQLIRYLGIQYTTTILKGYHQPDSINYLKNQSIFSSLFDTLNKYVDSASFIGVAPYSYVHSTLENELPSQVTRLLQTGKGDCHSLSYLYKIISDKIGAKCWLALAPNHIYIKNFSEQYGWYNTELTSRSFPSDAWIMASGYISADAVRSKIYMDTLSNQQSIGLCILDLAKAYEYETKNYYDGFILKCCDVVLQYHATNPMALLLKAETLKKVYLKQKAENTPAIKQAYDDMEAAYIALAKLHYREMPKEMYDKWVKEMQKAGK